MFLLCFIPFVGNIVMGYFMAKAFGKGQGFMIGLMFLPFIFVPMLGFDDSRYLVRASGIVSRAAAARLAAGIDIGGFVTSPAEVELLRHDRNSTVAQITIHEGKNRL